MKWEYRTHTIDISGIFSPGKVNAQETDNILNQYGQHGWELVSTTDTNTFKGESKLLVMIFKRPIE